MPSEADETSEEDESSDTDETATNEALSEPLSALSVYLPGGGFTDIAFDNITKLVQGKAALIRKALGDDLASDAEALPVEREDGMIMFPWFRIGMGADGVAAWAFWNRQYHRHFLSALPECQITDKLWRVEQFILRSEIGKPLS